MARFAIKVAVPASRLAVDGDTTGDDDFAKARRIDAANRVRHELEKVASQNGGTVEDVKYTRKGNVKAVVSHPYASTDDVIRVLNPLSQRAGASNLDVQRAV